MHIRLINPHMLGEYLKYIIPSMVALTLSSVFCILDGVFVGHAVGDAGLAGINVAFPLVTCVNAVATGIGMGGAVISSIARGEGDDARSQRAIGNAFLLLLIAGTPLAVLVNTFARPLCALLGGSGETLEQAVMFIETLSYAMPFQVIAAGCIPLVRNRGNVGYAMGTQLIATSINIALDFLFVFELDWGTAGAARATVCAQLFSFCSYVAYFVRKRNRIGLAALRPSGALVGHILRLGASPFGLTLLPDVTVVVVNINANLAGGETAVAAYAAISYVAFVAQMLIQGVADGSQPLISLHHGRRERDQVLRLRNTNYLVATGIGVAGLVAMTLLRNEVPLLFGTSAETAAIVAFALPIYSTAYMFIGFTHASTSYFYATDNPRASSIIVYGEAVLLAVVVTALTALFGITGTWVSITVVQVLLSCIAAFELHALESSQKRVRPADA